MTDYITRAELVGALREEAGREPDLDDPARLAWFPSLDRIADALAEQSKAETLDDKLRALRQEIIDRPQSGMTTALVPIELLGQVADMLAGREVITGVLRAAESALDGTSASLQQLGTTIRTWRAAGRPGLDA